MTQRWVPPRRTTNGVRPTTRSTPRSTTSSTTNGAHQRQRSTPRSTTRCTTNGVTTQMSTTTVGVRGPPHGVFRGSAHAANPYLLMFFFQVGFGVREWFHWIWASDLSGATELPREARSDRYSCLNSKLNISKHMCSENEFPTKEFTP